MFAQRPSLGQQRVWFLDRFARPQVSNVGWYARLAGELDYQRLARAYHEACRRHPVLAITLPTSDGQPRAAVCDPDVLDLHITRIDAAEVDPAQSQAGLLEEFVSRAFDLANGPLVRAQVITVDSDDHLLMMAAHRAVLDRLALIRFSQEVTDLYNSAASDVAPELTYEQVVSEQAAYIDGVAFEETMVAWRNYLAGIPPLELPTDRNRRPTPQYDAGLVQAILDQELVTLAGEYAEQQKVGTESVWRAGLQALLHRYSGQDLLAMGVSRPTFESWQQVVGPTSDTVVVRSEIDSATTFADLISVEERAPGRPIPFEKLIDALDPPRDPSRSPVVQTIFSDLPSLDRSLAGLTIIDEGFGASGATLYDLDCWIEQGAAGHRWCVVYRHDLFDRATIERLVRHYQNLLRALLRSPDQPIVSASLMDETERQLVLTEFNQTDVPYPADATVHELFEEQALRTPDKVAVTFEGQNLTYSELNARANQIAWLLRAHAVGRGTLVGICMERSLDYLPVVLGVLKSGGAYVPLDPAYPADRLLYVMEETGVKLLVTQEHLLAVVPGGDDTTKIVIDRNAAQLRSQPTDNPENVNSPDDLTYIVYTSGSTGRPKGVETIHRGVVGLVINTDILQLDEDTHYLQISPLSFDASTLEIFGPLLNGGRVVLLPPGIPTPARVANTVVTQKVNTLWLVAPLAHLTIDTQLDKLAGLRQFMIGGDVLSIPHIRRVREKYPELRLVNGYGPTEVTAFSVSYQIGHLPAEWPSIPIGKPMHNTTAYVLDEQMAPLPIGIWGELYLGGPRVGLGYHRRPELNAERFLPDPFQPGPANRLYRTGDRVRWLPNGEIQFQGRLDTQVKIDGIRVELGEIQSVIAEQEAVGAAVVTAPVINGRRKVIAYIVPHDLATFDLESLKTQVAAALPSVMRPASYVLIDTVPLTPNNKTDFAALPSPDLQSSHDYEPPATFVQQALARIWCETLGVEQIGLSDNFFQQGGHSLRAVAMLAAVSTVLGVDLSVQDVFDAPVLRQFADRVESAMLSALSDDELQRLLSGI